MKNTDEIQKKAKELYNTLKENCSSTTVKMTATFTAEGFTLEYENRTAEGLERDYISMRNLKGDFITEED